MVIMMEKNITKKIIVSAVSLGSVGVESYLTYLVAKFPKINFGYLELITIM